MKNRRLLKSVRCGVGGCGNLLAEVHSTPEPDRLTITTYERKVWTDNRTGRTRHVDRENAHPRPNPKGLKLVNVEWFPVALSCRDHAWVGLEISGDWLEKELDSDVKTAVVHDTDPRVAGFVIRPGPRGGPGMLYPEIDP